MIFWDYDAKNKIRTFNFNNQPITTCKVSNDKSFLAYALGYDFSKGPEGYG
jgi:mRNA export factor